ncbi:GTP-binding protein [Zavarzinella formosa]|uniref:GTP-binding protein n=1 Tax=Zavarzinella formosa TaxID=360055 RepID=UPI0003181BB4|nr:GTP-binding protein [Zavarzinella formosa]
MNPVRFVMIGGFLGAGKTTTIGRLAKMYMARGQRVGIVTNDQARDLVDTNNLRSQGLSVQEVPGACFCCKFNELVDRARQLTVGEIPDVILAEPVGSCTDLVSTVVLPLKDLHKGQFTVAPYPVIFKPSHGLRILRNESAGFSPKAAYIFRKQLEEADAILMNRIDELGEADQQELLTLLEREYPGVPVLPVSAKTGTGFEAVIDLLDRNDRFQNRVLDIDYDIYAEGEAELGWLNSTFDINSPTPFDLDHLMTSLIGLIADELKVRHAEVAHLKLIGLEDGASFAVANVVSSSGPGELSVASKAAVRQLNLIVNARVATDPEELDRLVQAIVLGECQRLGLTVKLQNTQFLRPGRPTPTHRYPASV